MGLDDPWWLQGTSPANMKKTYQCLKALSKKHISPHKTNKNVLKHNTLAKSPSESLIESETPSPLPNNHFCLQAPALRLVKFETRHEELQELRSSHVEAQRQVTQLKEVGPSDQQNDTPKPKNFQECWFTLHGWTHFNMEILNHLKQPSIFGWYLLVFGGGGVHNFASCGSGKV